MSQLPSRITVCATDKNKAIGNKRAVLPLLKRKHHHHGKLIKRTAATGKPKKAEKSNSIDSHGSFFIHGYTFQWIS